MVTDLHTRLRSTIGERLALAQAANVKQDDPHWWVSPVAGTGGEHFTVRSKREWLLADVSIQL